MAPQRPTLTALAVLVAACLLAAPAAQAREWTSGQKFGRGVSNMTLGILAWPGTMAQEAKERGPAIGIPLGFVTGIGWTVAHEVVGVYEFLTCVFEAPPRFKPVLEPEYPWQYFSDL